jgi:hypothetical protein
MSFKCLLDANLQALSAPAGICEPGNRDGTHADAASGVRFNLVKSLTVPTSQTITIVDRGLQ